jgi:hypothetical protein
MAERPWFPFYPSDWRGRARLRSCSAGARALLVEMMSIMHDGEPYGYLTIAGEALTTDAQIAKHVTMTKSEVRRWRCELLDKRLIAQADDGVIHNPRMVRDEEIRRKRAAGGRKSVEHPNVPAPKDSHEGSPSMNGGEDTHKGPTQIPETRGQKKNRVREHPLRNNSDSPTPLSAVVGQIMPKVNP